MKITTVSLLKNTPINTGGKTLSFFVNSILGRTHDLLFLYFHDEINKSGYEPNYVNFKQRYINGKRYFSFFSDKLKKMYLEFLLQKNILKNIKTDSVLLEFPYLFHIAKIISNFNGNCPIYLLEHNIEWQFYKKHGSKLWRIIKIFENYVIKNVDAVITISPVDYNFLLNEKNNKNIFLIEPGVLEDRFNPIGNSISFSQNQINILFYGTLHNNPTNMYAFDFICNELSKILPNDYILNICGNIQQYDNVHNIIFHGLVNNIENYIKKFDVVIVPLLNGAGVKMRILESLYCGRIVLASKYALEGLSPILKQVTIECNTKEEYMMQLEKLKNDSIYRKQLEFNIINAVNIYKTTAGDKINLIFTKQDDR